MRATLSVTLLLLIGTLHAQLSVGGDAGAGTLSELRAEWVPDVLPVAKPVGLQSKTMPGTRARALHAPAATPPQPTAFDFSAAKPHLAFFCRLELDIEEATRFPVRFRLGEVRTWQQELSKRD